MPELPDILLYLHALRPRVVGRTITGVRLVSPFLLRSIDPPLAQAVGKQVIDLHRFGKRIVFELEGEMFLVFHLMIAGRFRWKEPGAKIPGKVALLAIDLAERKRGGGPDHLRQGCGDSPEPRAKADGPQLHGGAGTLILTEAGTKRQASLYAVAGREGLDAHDPGGLEVLEASLPDFAIALQRENHTLKRGLTDPHLFSGIGNAYSDEILHAAKLSPFKQTGSLTDEEVRRLYEATRSTLETWIERLQEEIGEGFPEKVTAFREEMAVHGRYGKPCPVCGSPIQRIVYAANEANYCATCQTGGRLLADRSLSRLLKDDWPRTLEELERRRRGDL